MRVQVSLSPGESFATVAVTPLLHDALLQPTATLTHVLETLTPEVRTPHTIDPTCARACMPAFVHPHGVGVLLFASTACVCVLVCARDCVNTHGVGVLLFASTACVCWCHVCVCPPRVR